MKPYHSYNWMLLSCLTLICACGGGGGSGSSNPVQPATNTSAVANDDTLTLDEDTVATAMVLANDRDVDASSLRVSRQPSNGTAQLVGDGISYSPNPNFSGTDLVTYQVTDSSGTVLAANLNITVNPINDNPSAIADNVSVVVNTPTLLDVIANDSDIDGTIVSISVPTAPNNGAISIDGTAISYRPNIGFLGADSFEYQIEDNQGAQSNLVGVSIEVQPISNTNVVVTSLMIPTTGYAARNNVELATQLLDSTPIEFEVLPNAVSFVIALTGTSVNNDSSNLFISEITMPDGAIVETIEREVVFCDPGYCSGLIPRSPSEPVQHGTWSVRLGTRQNSLSGIEFSDMQLNIAQRTGPEQQSAVTTRLQVRPFLTATSVTLDDISLVLDRLVSTASANNIQLDLDPVIHITDPEFAEVSRNFSDTSTSVLISMGSTNRLNLFFLEDFSGSGASGLLGISGGLPGPFGQNSQFNGVLVNASAMRSQSDSDFARNTAEIALHEIGHFLGLYHTTERQFNLHDVINDTDECTVSSDQPSTGIRGVADIDECSDGQNLMFWNSDFSGNKQPLSSDQQRVIILSPLTQPAN